MELIRGLYNLRPRHHGCVASIGNFDGVHRGHQAIVERLRQRAADAGLPARVVLFEPQPAEFFRPDAAEPRLSRLREKLSALADLGIDGVLCLRFDADLAGMERQDFVERLLLQGLGVRHLVVGPDFRFGRGRSGDIDYLRSIGATSGFAVESLPPLLLGAQRVSSTAVRQCLLAGDLAGAA
ncbi:MAG: bifunctional riboflavin kinase/FAD synthetase, partial [Immundisolibacter sp.]